MIKARKVKKTYLMGDVKVPALRGVNLEIKKGEFVAVMGPSGSGKSTLLYQLSGLDTPTSGSVFVDKTNIANLTDRERTAFRLQKLGLIFQFYSLLPELTALENVYIPHMLMGNPKKECMAKAGEILEELGLEKRAAHLPRQLSGGEQQRVAIARALINRPKILMADEPTLNLDIEASLNLVEIFKRLNRKLKQTIVMVTHENFLGKKAKRIVWVQDGLISRKPGRMNNNF